MCPLWCTRFNGSSTGGFQQIEASDMLLTPDPSSAFVDPFTAHKTLVLIADISDPISGELYRRRVLGQAQRDCFPCAPSGKYQDLRSAMVKELEGVGIPTLLEGGVFTDDLLASYTELKREDVDTARLRPSPTEYEMYFDL